MTVKAHYDNHLSDFYEWMAGDFDTSQLTQQQFFERNNILPAGSNNVAVDLGCGHGIHAISLANLGFSVKAIDFNRQLLSSLENRKNNLDIETIYADFQSFKKYIDNAELVVCMGDTIAHLQSRNMLSNLFKNIQKTLITSGKMVISFRDYSHVLKDTERFIPVKADEHRILTCMLEFFDTKVRVTDLLYEKTDGQWQQKVSSYMKLRLQKDDVEKMIKAAGFNIIHTAFQNRMHYIIAAKN